MVGFGTAGRVFHAPFLHSDPHYALHAVVTRDEQRRAEVLARYPDTHVVSDVDALLDRAAELDLVVIGSPPATHAEFADAFLDAGVAVVVDKPFTVTSAEGRALVAKADRLGVPLTVFQNRRWDGDFRTLRRLLAEDALGEVWRFESRFEWWKPDRDPSWKTRTPASAGGGILYDLGTHVIDQAVRLFGTAVPVHCEVFTRDPGGSADDDAFVVLDHESGVRSHLWMNGLAAQAGPRFRVLGSRGAFTKHGLDPQEAALAAGARPTDPSFGHEPRSAWGRLGVDGTTRAVPTEPGRYAEFYALLARALLAGEPVPVNPLDSVRVIELIERLLSTPAPATRRSPQP
ncbi:Gfo/Idh/MocA family protein [Goodfellowiella coeruleoviolacea]|uniref:Dehydrogenase n=1 Tax=Goodfellowiella coeruleoviolacea TaxID=334858 RepID=A0AAE3G8F0_9PSEU|nr:Gfo/Idh/MocA family oxidoreductase [Goodfellowiella coeruleoviolacea]MCP2163577.1 putative dehydrogenase [Goodfellowiella coeruleoviolacea]